MLSHPHRVSGPRTQRVAGRSTGEARRTTRPPIEIP